MKKYAIIGLIFIISGCSRQWCEQHYPKQDSTTYIETAKIDTIYIPMPADTVFIESQIDCPDQRIIYKDGKVEYKVIIKDKVLTIYRVSEKDSLRLIYAYKNTDEYKKLTQIKEVVKIKEKAPKWAWYSLAINILLLGFTTRKFWLKFLQFPV